MKRLLMPLPLLLGGVVTSLLAGCGSLNAGPSAGELLDAPTSLNVMGRVVTAQTTSTLNGSLFSVNVKLQTPRTLPPLNPTNVYVVTNDGVWSAALNRSAPWKCGPSCTLAVARGPANGLQAGQGVQIVVGLRDTQGRTLLLRDAQAKVR